MDFGAAMFFTDYSMPPGDLGRALEERGFESLWAPEHSHIPVSRASPFPNGGELPKQYYDVMDPFVTLTAAAAATKTLNVGTGVCRVPQRDPVRRWLGAARLAPRVRRCQRLPAAVPPDGGRGRTRSGIIAAHHVPRRGTAGPAAPLSRHRHCARGHHLAIGNVG